MWTFLRYSLIGAVATGVHYLVLFLLVEVGHIAASYSAAIGATCGAVLAFFGNRQFTFPAVPGPSQYWLAFARFLAVATLGVALSAAIVWTVIHLFSWHYLAGQAIASLLVLLLTFCLNRIWTFQ